MKLFFDTETTGKADFRAEPNAPHQPRIVQLAAILTDHTGLESQSINLVIKPEGWEIPKEASDIHGITTQFATQIGVPIRYALKVFRCFWNASELAVAHNSDFDLLMLDCEFFRHAGGRVSWGDPKDTFCTMKNMTPICQLPGNYGKYKWPKLQEAHRHCFGVEFDGAHDALADVRACAKVYFWLCEKIKEKQSDNVPL